MIFMYKYYTALYHDKPIDFYVEGNQFYMISEDIGKCFGFSNPRIQLNSFIKARPEWDSPRYTLFMPVEGKGSKKLRSFTSIGAVRLARCRGNDDLADWLENIFHGLEDGVITSNVPEQEIPERKVAPAPEPAGNNDDSTAMNIQRAQVLATAARCMTNAEDRDYLVQLAIALLVNDDFDQTRNQLTIN